MSWDVGIVLGIAIRERSNGLCCLCAHSRDYVRHGDARMTDTYSTVRRNASSEQREKAQNKPNKGNVFLSAIYSTSVRYAFPPGESSGPATKAKTAITTTRARFVSKLYTMNRAIDTIGACFVSKRYTIYRAIAPALHLSLTCATQKFQSMPFVFYFVSVPCLPPELLLFHHTLWECGWIGQSIINTRYHTYYREL